MMSSRNSGALSRAEPVGFIGLGAMGAPMARRLATLGYNLLVFDLNTKAVQSVVDCGARSTSSIGEIASSARLVFTCLPSLEALEAVILGKSGLQDGNVVETVVDFSTTGATFACEVAKSLQCHGIDMLDAPITGNVTTAGNGKLGIMCSGPLQAFQQAEEIMQDLASAIVLYLGEQTGRAQRLKLLNNLLSATGMAVSCEAFILGVKWGLDPQVMLDVINAGEASSSATRNKFPQAILPRRFDFGARMAITAKDTSLTVKESEELGVPMWIGQSVRQIWNYAASQGGADKDGTSLITFLEPWAGVTVQAPAFKRDTSVKVCQDSTANVLLICDEPDLRTIKTRLQNVGWECSSPDAHTDVRAAPEVPAPGGFRRCLVMGIPVGGTLNTLRTASAHGRVSGRIVVNLSLMSSAVSMEFAEELAGCGEIYLDAALTGTQRDVESGGRPVLVSGPADAIGRVASLLQCISSQVVHVSATPGAAHVMQQINGSLFSTLLAVTCEAFVAGAKAGLEPLTMTKIMGVETGRNAASERIVPQEIATRNFGHGKSISRAVRELSLLSDEARELGLSPWILDKARLLYTLASQLGNGADDITRIVTRYEGWAKTEVKS